MIDSAGYLGHRHATVRVPLYKGSLSRSVEGREQEQESVGGGVRLYVSPRRKRRSWSVSSPVTQAELADLTHLDAALMPPFVWLSPRAHDLNALSPEGSTLLQVPGLSAVGGTPLADGGHAPSAAAPLDPAVATRLAFAPVRAGRPVSVGLYAGGGTLTLGVDWMDAADRYLTSTVTTQAVGSVPERVLIEGAMPPAGASYAYVTAKGAQVIARASLSWTSTARPWVIGEGCENAYLTGLSDSLDRLAGADLGGGMGEVSFEIKELL